VKEEEGGPSEGGEFGRREVEEEKGRAHQASVGGEFGRREAEEGGGPSE
jgi:hypothetical protein